MMKIQMRLSASISQKPVQRAICGRLRDPPPGAAARIAFLRRSAMSRWPDGRAAARARRRPRSATECLPAATSIASHAARPRNPAASPRTGPPITLAAGTAARNRAMNRARVACGKPIGHVEDHAGIKPGLRQPQQKAQHIKANAVLSRRRSPSRPAPSDHDAAHPDPRADLLQHQVGRHLEQEIAEEKNPGAEAEHLGEKPRSWFMVSAAKPIFTRSRKLATYIRAITGISRLAARARIASAAPCVSPHPLHSLIFCRARRLRRSRFFLVWSRAFAYIARLPDGCGRRTPLSGGSVMSRGSGEPKRRRVSAPDRSARQEKDRTWLFTSIS